MAAFSVAALLTFSSGHAGAQECSDLATIIGRESEKTGDSRQVEALNKAHFCSSKYQSAGKEEQAQISASYGLFGGSAGASTMQIEAKQEQECGDYYGKHWSSKVTSKELERVSNAGADVIKACINSRSFRLVNLAIEDESIVASFRYGGAKSTLISGVIVSPQDAAKCLVMNEGRTDSDLSKLVGKELHSGSTITLICNRQADPLSSSASQKRFSGGFLGLSTIDDTAEVPLIAYSRPPLPQPVAETLTANVGALGADVKTLREDLLKLRSSVSSIPFYQCPEFGGHSTLGGGSWGFYGCQGQLTSQATCVVMEFPKSQYYACTPVGKLAIEQPQ